jgi:hypothetical protein
MLSAAYLDLSSQPLETAEESTSSACDFGKFVFISEVIDSARVDPTELTG